MRWLARLSLGLTPMFLLICAWQTAVALRPRLDFFVGSPLGVGRRLLEMTFDGSLVHATAVTGTEAILGFAAGNLAGACLGLALWFFPRVQAVAKPYVVALGAVPVFALGPILVFWFGTGILSKTVLGFLSTFVIALEQAHTGAQEADARLVRVIRVFGGTRADVFRRVVAPSAIIWVLSAARLNIGMALLGAFVGEFISSQAGLGHLIIVAHGLYDVNGILAGIVGLVVLALAFHLAIRPVEMWASPRR